MLKVIGSMKEALHPELDGCDGIYRVMARPQTAIVSLTVTEKGYCTDAASGQLDLNNPLIKHDLANPGAPKSAIGYIVQALHLRREQGLAAFTVMSCDNVRENGHVAKVAVLGLAQARDPQLAQWIEANATFPCTMVDRIVPAATPETLQEIADQLGVYVRVLSPVSHSVSGLSKITLLTVALTGTTLVRSSLPMWCRLK